MSYSGRGWLIALPVLFLAFGAQAWWIGEEDAKPAPIVTAPPVSDDELAALPGDRRMQYEGECTLAAMDRAKQLQAQEDGFLAANRDYINHCILSHARKDGLAHAGAAK